MAVEQTTRVELFETIPIIPLGTYGPGVIEKKMHAQGNSLLSTLFVKSIDGGATLDVSYHEATTGEDDGEDALLESHVTPAAGQTNKIIVSRIHNKPRIRANITGGQATFGVYITVVSSFASDMDGALVQDAQTANITTALGMQTAIYDPVRGKFFFARGYNGIQDVNVTEVGVHKIFKSSDSLTSTINVQQTSISQVVPASKKWKLRLCNGFSRIYGEYVIIVNGSRIGKFYTGPGESNGKYLFAPYYEVVDSDVVEVKFIQSYGPEADVQSFLHVTEEDI